MPRKPSDLYFALIAAKFGEVTSRIALTSETRLDVSKEAPISVVAVKSVVSPSEMTFEVATFEHEAKELASSKEPKSAVEMDKAFVMICSTRQYE